MLETLTEKLALTFRKLRGYGRLNDAVIDEALREVRMSLLEADVNFRVVRDFVNRVAERARGQEVMKSLTLAQQVVKIVRDELVAVMGGEAAPLDLGNERPARIMLVGLQGSGKTTTVGKLARHLESQGRSCLLVACDVHRPAAAQQLATIGGQLGVPVVRPAPGEALDALARRAVTEAPGKGVDTVIFDTAGRLHVDEEMMEEAVLLARAAGPSETLLVADAMTGQDAVNVARGFAGKLDLTGIVLTKFDGDARGGAALSMRQVTGVPVKFVGLGEKLDALEVFHPDRLASRILGMGDVLGLIEKAEQVIDREEAVALEKKIRQNRFTLEDFAGNLKMVKRMGSMKEILSMIPGLGAAAGGLEADLDERRVKRLEAIISSMTGEERRNHKMINLSRRRRIARGSGTRLEDVNRLIKQFDSTQKMMKRLNKTGAKVPRSLRGGRGLFPA